MLKSIPQFGTMALLALLLHASLQRLASRLGLGVLEVAKSGRSGASKLTMSRFLGVGSTLARVLEVPP